MTDPSNWKLVNSVYAPAREIADRHYNRQTPGSRRFAPPGRCMVLWQPDALWVTSWPFAQYTKHDWAGCFINSTFRNEGAGLSSELIEQALAHTLWFACRKESWFKDPLPEGGMVTFVDRREIESDNPGYCYKMAGFEKVGETKVNELPALQRRLLDFPEPLAPTLTDSSPL